MENTDYPDEIHLHICSRAGVQHPDFLWLGRRVAQKVASNPTFSLSVPAKNLAFDHSLYQGRVDEPTHFFLPFILEVGVNWNLVPRRTRLRYIVAPVFLICRPAKLLVYSSWRRRIAVEMQCSLRVFGGVLGPTWR